MEKLKVYWFGYGGGSWMADRLRILIEDTLGMKLYTIHEHPNCDIKWSKDTVYEELKKADIIIVPANYKRQPCKSNNRLTQAMALGKPVICEPLPAYKSIIKQGVNGFITENNSEEEWEKYLVKLKYIPNLRESMGKEALKTATEYTTEKAANKWITALYRFKKKLKANIDVIIPTKKNHEILHECLKSFNNSTQNEEIYIIDNGGDLDVKDLVNRYGVPVEIKELM